MRHATNHPLTPEMCRAGRALLGITQAQLARRSGVSRLTVAHFERAARKPIPASLAAIRSALEASGIALLPGGAIVRSQGSEAIPSAPINAQRIPDLLHILRSAAPRLQELGVEHLSLFGSTVRGIDRPDSDLDLLLDLDAQRRMDLLDYAEIVAEIQKLVPQRVDVARRDKLKSHVALDALRHEIHVF
jgi:predicted nucleotidyltransferase/DNA-binding XRE family transcriptional regulator